MPKLIKENYQCTPTHELITLKHPVLDLIYVSFIYTTEI